MMVFFEFERFDYCFHWKKCLLVDSTELRFQIHGVLFEIAAYAEWEHVARYLMMMVVVVVVAVPSLLVLYFVCGMFLVVFDFHFSSFGFCCNWCCWCCPFDVCHLNLFLVFMKR